VEQKRLDQGFAELIEGNPARAEHVLRRLVRDTDKPLAAYLAAARAAQQQGALGRRDYYLELAQQSGSNGIAVDLSRAELQLAQGQYADALALLTKLRGAYPHHRQVLRMLAKLYQQTGDWGRLNALLPEVRQYKALHADQQHVLAAQALRQLMRTAVRERDLPALQQHWSGATRMLKVDEGLLADYAECLLRLGADEQAEALLVEAVNRLWDPQLAYLYGNLREGDANRQLTTVEEWLNRHPADHRLMLAAARLCMRGELWGKAKHYLEDSIARKPTAEGYQLLGALLERDEDAAKALEAYRKGLRLMSTNLDGKALPPAAGKPG
jgi:HemY protein